MRSIALSLLLLFTTFTVVLSSYGLWQKGKTTPIVLVEEEEDHHGKSCDLKTFLRTDFAPHMELDAELKNIVPSMAVADRSYEDVYLNTPFSPPDVLLHG